MLAANSEMKWTANGIHITIIYSLPANANATVRELVKLCHVTGHVVYRILQLTAVHWRNLYLFIHSCKLRAHFQNIIAEKYKIGWNLSRIQFHLYFSYPQGWFTGGLSYPVPGKEIL